MTLYYETFPGQKPPAHQCLNADDDKVWAPLKFKKYIMSVFPHVKNRITLTIHVNWTGK